MEIPSYNSLIQRSVQKHWDLDALSDYGVETFKYKDVAVIVARLHLLYDRIGIKPGDKIALCGRNKQPGALPGKLPALLELHNQDGKYILPLHL